MGPDWSKVPRFEINRLWIHSINEGADRHRNDDEYEHKNPDNSTFVLSKLTPDVVPHRPVFGFNYSGIH